MVIRTQMYEQLRAIRSQMYVWIEYLYIYIYKQIISFRDQEERSWSLLKKNYHDQNIISSYNKRFN